MFLRLVLLLSSVSVDVGGYGRGSDAPNVEGVATPLYFEGSDQNIPLFEEGSNKPIFEKANNRVPRAVSPDDPDYIEGKSNGIAVPRPDVRRFKRQTGGLVNGLSPEQQRESVEIHNILRRLEPAANMEFMIWNDYLAAMAQEWAETCLWEHGQPDRDKEEMPFQQVGQNLYFNTGTRINVTHANIRFYEEKNFYTWETGACNGPFGCGHYTQLVWGTSREIGCGFTVCEELVDREKNKTFRNANYLACDFGPAGNFVGQKPYVLGPACSECASGEQWCDKEAPRGLCRRDCSEVSDNCTCDVECQNAGIVDCNCSCHCQANWTGHSCREACQDNHRNCGRSPGWPQYTCTHPQYGPAIRGYCPKLCGICSTTEPADIEPCEFYPTTSAEATTTTPPITTTATTTTTAPTTTSTTTLPTTTTTTPSTSTRSTTSPSPTTASPSIKPTTSDSGIGGITGSTGSATGTTTKPVTGRTASTTESTLGSTGSPSGYPTGTPTVSPTGGPEVTTAGVDVEGATYRMWVLALIVVAVDVFLMAVAGCLIVLIRRRLREKRAKKYQSQAPRRITIDDTSKPQTAPAGSYTNSSFAGESSTDPDQVKLQMNGKTDISEPVNPYVNGQQVEASLKKRDSGRSVGSGTDKVRNSKNSLKGRLSSVEFDEIRKMDERRSTTGFMEY